MYRRRKNLKKVELITGIVSGIAVGIILSPNKVYELKTKTKENYYKFLLDNGPITKEMIINYLKEKKAAYKKRENDEALDGIEQEKNNDEKLVSNVPVAEE